MPDNPDSAIAAGAKALHKVENVWCRRAWDDIPPPKRRELEEHAKLVLDAADPEPTKDELKKCREGGQDCLRCQAMLDAGLNPHTGESLESAAYPEQTEGEKDRSRPTSHRRTGPAPRSDSPGRRGASQPVVKEGEEYVPKSFLIAAEQERDEARAVIARFEPVLERDPRYLAMKSKAEAAVADRDRLQRELDSPERDKALQIVIDQTRAEREAFRADRDRLQRELGEWKEGYENLEWSVQTLSPLVARVKALEGALSMLVELKDMQEHEHDRYESVEGKVAKRDAWQAARAALKGEQS